MPTRKSTDHQRHLASLSIPLLSVGIGIAYLIAGLLGGRPGFGVFGLLLMAGLALALWLVRRRSETVQGLMDRRDERINAIDLKATALAGLVVIVAVLAAFIVEIARGHDGMPYAWLGAVGGIAYLLAVIVQRLRG